MADRPPARFGTNTNLQCSMISAGCDIRGTVVNSVLSPGVVVEEGAVVQNSILFTDCVVKKNATVDLAIFDKQVRVGSGAVVGAGTNHDIANKEQPSHLYTGITLVGKEAEVPPGQSIGRNCIIHPKTREDAYPGKEIADGESL